MKFDVARFSAAVDSHVLTVAQIAERSGVGKSAIYSWMSGEKAPRSETLAGVAAVLGRSVDEFFYKQIPPQRTA